MGTNKGYELVNIVNAARTCRGGEAAGENPAQVGRVGPGKEFGL